MPAPLFLNLVNDWQFSTQLNNNPSGIDLDYLIITNLDFADDICLLDDNIENAQTLLKQVTNTATEGCLEINISTKTSVLPRPWPNDLQRKAH